jgi:hypothetical protein
MRLLDGLGCSSPVAAGVGSLWSSPFAGLAGMDRWALPDPGVGADSGEATHSAPDGGSPFPGEWTIRLGLPNDRLNPHRYRARAVSDHQ